MLDADGNQINSVGLAFYGDAAGDALQALTVALARLKYKRLSDWQQSGTSRYTTHVERF